MLSMKLKKSLTITLSGKDAENFEKIIGKIITEQDKVGLKNTLITTDELQVLKDIKNKL